MVWPFGLRLASETFLLLINTVLLGLNCQTCLGYLDDITVFSGTFEGHLRRLLAVL